MFDIEQMIPLKKIAEMLEVDIETMRRAVQQKKLIAYRFGKGYRVKSEDLQKYIEGQKVGVEK